MNPHGPKNIAASVRQRLLNISRSEGRPFQEVLQFYAMERFLYRLSRSACVEKYILKGALLLRVWCAPVARPTMDIDILGKTANEPEVIVRQMREVLSVPVETDGLVFDASSIRAMRITEGANYEGVRIRFHGTLEAARVNMQIDIGFGDVVFPQPEMIVLPTLLGFSAPHLVGYSRESVIAEKFEAIVKLGEINSRMKDFYDIWLLSRSFDFGGESLVEAIRLTFARRGTGFKKSIAAFSHDFAILKQTQWRAFWRRLRAETAPRDFAIVTSSIAEFLLPLVQTLCTSAPAPGKWRVSGGWTTGNGEYSHPTQE